MKTCDCFEPDYSGEYVLIGDVDMMICGVGAIQGTAQTHTDDDEEE